MLTNKSEEVGMSREIPRSWPKMLLLALVALLCFSPRISVQAGPEDPKSISDARRLWQNGRYAEALEAYDELNNAPGKRSPEATATIALGRADCLASQGDVAQALALLKSALETQAKNADLLARVASLKLSQGDRDGAEADAAAAIQADPDHLQAHWVTARLFEERGELEKALEGWKWFVDAYNVRGRTIEKSAEGLLFVGQASQRYYHAKARGDELVDSLKTVLSIYEDALKVDPHCWQAPWLVGQMFLADYNEAKAVPELNRALQINPMAAEVLVTLGQADLQGYRLASGRSKAERALRVNPHYAPAHILVADLNISDERFLDAKDAAKKAVAENPKNEEALARLAASCRLLVDPAGASAAEALALAGNPRPATFYAALGERLADRRKYPEAERAYLLAAQADPERPDAPIGLGMLYMQIGRETEANALFKASFDADPGNERALNQMLVLKHMATFQPVNTDHFSVLVEPKLDSLIGKYMARYLESVYPELTARFGYSPPNVTKIEILDTHKWFSARTIGLPFIPTVGACTGSVVALASPRATNKPFNWARVLKHEAVHVITLQQTSFNIPHWYTEALAVESEGYPRPQEWNKMLLERVPTRSRLLNLDTVNLGFIRPKEPEERSLAYCQSQLYARYMLKRFGSDALIKMLAAYRRGLTTDRAITECFHVDKADFEAQYLTFLDEVVKTIRTRVSEEKPVKFSQLEKMVKEKPDDPDLNARMAYEHYARRDLKEARPFADKALKLQPKHPLASYVKARLLTTIGDEDAALELLRPALDREKPNERVIDLLAQLEMKRGNLDEAESLYELARRDDPYHTKWIANLARVHLRQKDNAKFLTDMAMIADNDADDLDVRKVLAEKHLAAGEPEKSERWASECLYIDVYDAENHVLLADAQSALKKYGPAIEEYQTALDLKPKKVADLKVKLARAQFGLGQRDAAKATLDAILKDDPDHPEAKALRKEIDS
jgi:Tfp pilus assembly protein PilF